MTKLLSVLLASAFAATLSVGAMAADVTPASPAAAAASTPAADAKAPAKVEHKSHVKHQNHKAK